MSRYIDYDDLDYRNDMMHGKSSEFLDGVIFMAQRIEEAPSIDIVRCKDCKHYHVETYLLYGDYETLKWCDLLNIRGKIPPDPKPMDFCSYGERKETDHE